MTSDFSNLTPEQLDKMDKRALIAIISSLQGQLSAVSNQLNFLTEQIIRPFTIGRKNWVCIATPKGAKASAILYSLVETAKANNLRLLDYFEYLLSEMAKYSKDKDQSYIQDLLPWSKKIQKEFRIGTQVKKSIIKVQ